jgi:predicted GIY-YIG superfamily endonuclease
MINNGFYLYILRCNDKSYYIGHTDELEKRFAEHQSGAFECYTSTRRPLKLVYSELFQTRDEAWLAEQKIKGWSRKKKEILIKHGFSGFKK